MLKRLGTAARSSSSEAKKSRRITCRRTNQETEPNHRDVSGGDKIATAWLSQSGVGGGLTIGVSVYRVG
jgi:hypothetical protein